MTYLYYICIIYNINIRTGFDPLKEGEEKMKKIKGLISVLMTLVTVILFFACTQMSAFAASTAAFDKLSTSTYAKTYTLSSSGITKPYTSNKLTTRGSVTYGSSSTAYIDNASDELYVFDVGKNSSGKYYAYVSYPISSSKRAKAYIPLSAITSNNSSHKAVTSKGKFYCSTRSNNSTSKSYYVDKGDKVYLIATKDSKYQIMYPNSSGMWRIAWCSKTDYNKYCASSSTISSTPSTSSTYSVSGNILAVKGVKLSEYPIGSKYSTSRYANINGKSVDMFAWQCCGYARYVQTKIYGSHYKNNPSHFPNLYGYTSASSLTVSKLKTMITNAGVGAHIRIGEKEGNPHSMIVIAVNSNGFTMTDANYDGKNTIRIKEYTWSSYLSSNYGSRSISYIEVYKK